MTAWDIDLLKSLYFRMLASALGVNTRDKNIMTWLIFGSRSAHSTQKICPTVDLSCLAISVILHVPDHGRQQTMRSSLPISAKPSSFVQIGIVSPNGTRAQDGSSPGSSAGSDVPTPAKSSLGSLPNTNGTSWNRGVPYVF